jgi:hypothetical protein
MASKVQICNLALSKIGASNIIALDNETKEGRQCSYLFDLMRDAVLTSYPWNFALKRAELAQLSEVPDFEFYYQYQLPSDCLRVVDIYDSGSDYVIEGDRLLTDDDEVNIKYIARIADTTLYHPNFIEAFSLRLAADLAVAIANDKSLKATLLQEYRLAVFEAYKLNAIEGKPDEEKEQTSWQQAGR